MRKEHIEDLEGEIWIQDSGYEISDKGRIITKQGKLFKGNITSFGYVSAHVEFDDGFIARSAHRAVAHVFIPNPNNLPEVNHIDGDKENNCVENLEWCTKKENQGHASYVLGKRVGSDCYKHKLTEAEVLEIYDLCKEGKLKYLDIGKQYGVSMYSVSYIALGKSWKCLNLEPLPPLIRGSRGRGKKVFWINENKEYPSVVKCYEDMKNTYGITICDESIKKICNGEIEEHKGQKFKWI